jgi:TonB family protein
MNNLFPYLLEMNAAMIIFYAAYRLLFGKDRNFNVRRIYLIATVIVPVLLVLLPEPARSLTGRFTPLVIQLDQITVTGQGTGQGAGGMLSLRTWAVILYLSLVVLGMIKLTVQLLRIMRIAGHSGRMELGGTRLYASADLHASSFFGYIFMDPARMGQESFSHILEHELFHKRGWHSADRILAELVVIVHWFNPVAWLLRRSVIENLEYLTDSAMVEKGTDLRHYQLSLLNQYMGSASITNQFNSQIKNRINMLNKNYKQGSIWKLAMIFPLAFMTMFFFSCTETENTIPTDENVLEQSKKTETEKVPDEEVFYIVEEMPLFQNEDPAQSFRIYLAQNLRYPEIAKENGISGRVIIQFTVNKQGKVQDAVVVKGADPALDKEAIRVVMSSPEWTPGKQRGKNVNVLYTFPINFAL